jgi:hypothetical protein
LSSGTLKVLGGTTPVTFNLSGSLFVWSGGTIDTTNGNLVILGTLNLTGVSVHETLTGGGTLTVGSATQAGTVNDLSSANTLQINTGTTLVVAADGVFNIGDATLSGGGGMSNTGLFRKTTGTSGATVSVFTDSPGKVEDDSGTLLFSGTVNQNFSGTLTGGTWTVVGSSTVVSTLTLSAAGFTTIGLAASVSLSGPNSTFSNLSTLATNNGNLSLLSGSALSLSASVFTNKGNLLLGPGSVLSVVGFTQTSTGVETADVGGTNTAPLVGSLTATGPITLGGLLEVSSTVVPAVGTKLQILTDGGTSTITGAYSNLAEGATFQETVNGTLMTFQVTYKGGTGSKNVVLTRIS